MARLPVNRRAVSAASRAPGLVATMTTTIVQANCDGMLSNTVSHVVGKQRNAIREINRQNREGAPVTDQEDDRTDHAACHPNGTGIRQPDKADFDRRGKFPVPIRPGCAIQRSQHSNSPRCRKHQPENVTVPPGSSPSVNRETINSARSWRDTSGLPNDPSSDAVHLPVPGLSVRATGWISV